MITKYWKEEVMEDKKVWCSQFIYKPPMMDKPPLDCTFGVRFCQDTFLTKSYLDEKGIDYDINDLEMTPYGLALRIKKDKEKEKGLYHVVRFLS